MASRDPAQRDNSRLGNSYLIDTHRSAPNDNSAARYVATPQSAPTSRSSWRGAGSRRARQLSARSRNDSCSRAQDGPFGARRPRIAYSYRMPSAVATSTATCAAWRIDGLGIGLRQPGSILGTRTSCRLLRPRAQLPSVEATRAAPRAACPHARTVAGAVRPTSLPHHGAAWEAQQHTREKGVATTFPRVTACKVMGPGNIPAWSKLHPAAAWGAGCMYAQQALQHLHAAESCSRRSGRA